MLQALIERWEQLNTFIEQGGGVLTAIFAVTLVLWTLILERMWFGWRVYPRLAKKAVAEWESRTDHVSWIAEQIRRQTISEVHQQLGMSLTMIRTLIALCPLLGLLGTVTGMIEVFDVMALVGSGNARAMADGVYKATIPTMAGMVIALSGMYFSARLDRQARNRVAKLEDMLKTERGEQCAVG